MIFAPRALDVKLEVNLTSMAIKVPRGDEEFVWIN